MRNLAILGNDAKAVFAARGDVETIPIDDYPVNCGIVETEAPRFDPNAEGNECNVLFRVRAFSLNYRDKNRIFTTLVKGASTGFYVVGSEFAGEVLEVGRGVTKFAPGDRVIGDNSYPATECDGVKPGVPTNHGSREIQILHQAKLMKIPDSMPDETGAAFSIGAQTTYSMIRRLELRPGTNVLVTSAKSNTSLFAIHALKNRNVNLYAISSSNRFEKELLEAGVKELIVVDPAGGSFGRNPAFAQVMKQGGFHFVIDPYFDLHLSRVLDVMAIGGKYITCGLHDQYLALIAKEPHRAPRTGNELVTIMMKNIHVIGNCIGVTSDLKRAAHDFDRGTLDVTVDSVFTGGGRAAEFLDRTYNARDRFGKVIYQYE